jgi:hypothetical protein
MRRRHRDQGWDYQRPGAVTPALPSPLAGVPRSLVRDAMRGYQPLPVEPFPAGWVPSPDGAGLIPAPAAPKPFTAARRAAMSAGHQHRRQLIPWLAFPLLPVLALAGYLGHVQAAVTAFAGVAALVAARRVWPSCRKAGWRTATWQLGRVALAAGWVTWASWCGLTRSQALAIYVVIWALFSLPHWNRHRVRHEHGKPAAGAQHIALTPDQLLDRLRTRVCGSGQRLAGVVVSPAAPMKGGRAFLFTGIPGKHTTEHILGAAGEIASAAEAPRSRVVVEPAPGELPGEHGPAHLAKVTVLDAQNIHREIQEFDGLTFDPATGLFLVGPYADGEMAPSRLCKVDENGNPMRAASGLTCGCQGSGKSRYVEHKLVEHLMCGLFKVFFLDGQGGASIPAILDHVDWPATRSDEWQLCLRAAIRLMIARTRQQSARRIPCWFATPDDPFVQVVIEEAHKPLRDPLNLRMVKTLLQEGEKVGIGVDVVTQFPSQVELGGASGTTGANVLRSLATAGNVNLFRTGDESSKSMAVGAVEVNPRLLPQIPGMCHPLGASMRLAPARAIRVADPAKWAAMAPKTTFSGLDLAALGEDYESRWARFAEVDAEVDAGSLDMDSLAAELLLITGEEAPEEGARPAAMAQSRTVVQSCWDIISKDGSAKRADLISSLACSPSAVEQALAALARTGKIRKGGGTGVWELATGLHAVPAGERDA